MTEQIVERWSRVDNQGGKQICDRQTGKRQSIELVMPNRAQQSRGQSRGERHS
jgi:hypothetical protein